MTARALPLLLAFSAACGSEPASSDGVGAAGSSSQSGPGGGPGASTGPSGGAGDGGASTGGGSPSAGGGGAASDSACPLPAYPDASCTGVPEGTSLTVVEGDLDVDAAGTVIDGQDIHGCVNVTAPGVVIRNSRVSCANFIVVASFGGAYAGVGLLIEDSELDCQNAGGTAVGDTNFTVRRVDIHGCENGFDIDGDVVIEDSYIHDLYQSDEAHSDGAQVTPVGHDITIRHNTIYANEGTSAIITPKISSGVVANVDIRDNLMAGGAYSLYCPGEGPGSDFRVVDNHFSTVFYPTVGAFGPWTDCEDEPEVHGNVYHETSRPLPGQ